MSEAQRNEYPSEVKRDDVDSVVSVRCVGVDNKQHVFEPHKDKTLCGIKIKRKKLLKNDWGLFSCYSCTY